MKKLKLNLNKQSLIRLSSEETAHLVGGGINNSNNKGGACKYSRNHPKVEICVDADGDPHECVTGCVAKAAAVKRPASVSPVRRF